MNCLWRDSISVGSLDFRYELLQNASEDFRRCLLITVFVAAVYVCYTNVFIRKLVGDVIKDD